MHMIACVPHALMSTHARARLGHTPLTLSASSPTHHAASSHVHMCTHAGAVSSRTSRSQAAAQLRLLCTQVTTSSRLPAHESPPPAVSIPPSFSLHNALSLTYCSPIHIRLSSAQVKQEKRAEWVPAHRAAASATHTHGHSLLQPSPASADTTDSVRALPAHSILRGN